MNKSSVTNVLSNRCKCCLRERSSKDLWSDHFSDGDTENYGAMITSCFQLPWREPELEQERICNPCIGRLQDAHFFKQQVLEAQHFMSEIIDEDEKDIEQKIEEFLEKHLNIPTKSKDTRIMKTEVLDNDHDYDSTCTYTDVEYLEIENDDKNCNENVTLVSSDENLNLETEIVNDIVMIGNTAIKKVKLGAPHPSQVPKKDKKAPNEPTLSQSYDEITDISSNEKHKEKKKNTYIPKPPEENRNIKYQVQRIKHQDNLSALLLSTNATPIHKKRDNGYECGFCSKSYIIPSDLKTHVRQHHTDEEKDKYMAERELCTFIVKLDITDFQCNHCGLPLHSPESAFEHLKTHDITVHMDIKNQFIPYKFESEPYKCFICGAEFAHFRAITLHMNIHYPNYTCESCGAGYITNRSMLLHARMHGDGSYKCSYCPKQFNVRHKWKMHERAVHQKKKGRLSNVCGFCGERFKDHIKKYRHLEQAHGVQRTMYECDLCGKHLACKKTLRNHIANVHYRLKNFQCPMCEKECYDKTNMARHIETHKNKFTKRVKGMRCDYCPKLFSREASLKLHLRAHIGDKHHICEFCSEVFLMKAGLLSHLRSKHGVNYVDSSTLEDPLDLMIS